MKHLLKKMSKIKKIKIECFRGIKHPIVIDFKKGNNITSAAIYGRNGSGKSSLVDAWEWLDSFKIAHLAREGAGEKDYPNKTCNLDNCYIEVEFEGHSQDRRKYRYRTSCTIPGIYLLYCSLFRQYH